MWAGVFWEIGKLGNGLGLFFRNRAPVCKHSLGAPIYFPMLCPYLFINAGCVYKHGFGTLIVTLMFLLVLTLLLLLILVDFKIHGNIDISLDANLGAPSSLLITNTTANGNCDTDISRNTSIYTGMDASSTNATQLTKYGYNHKYNTKTFTNMSTNTSMKNNCQYNTKTFTSTSTNTRTKNSIRICMDTNNYIHKLSKNNIIIDWCWTLTWCQSYQHLHASTDIRVTMNICANSNMNSSSSSSSRYASQYKVWDTWALILILMRIRVSVLLGRLCLKIVTRVLDDAIITSITTARVTIIHETANTKAALQAILVQTLTAAWKLVFGLIQIQYESLNQYFLYYQY